MMVSHRSPPFPLNLLILIYVRFANLTIATLDDLDDPIAADTSDRAPLTGNIQQQSRNTQSYLTSTIPGEDRRAPQNTIDETVWETVRRDLLGVWEKMRQVLYPKYLFGGMMAQGGGIGGAERGEAGTGAGGGHGDDWRTALGNARSLVGRWPSAEVVLQGGMSDGLRDWDLWYDPQAFLLY
jgi:protein YIPF6